MEATVCLCPCCCLSKLLTGVARGSLLPLNQVLSLRWHRESRLLGSHVFLHDVFGCDQVKCLPLVLQTFVWLCSGSVSSRSLSCHFHRLVSERISAFIGLADGHYDDGIRHDFLATMQEMRDLWEYLIINVLSEIECLRVSGLGCSFRKLCSTSACWRRRRELPVLVSWWESCSRFYTICPV